MFLRRDFSRHWSSWKPVPTSVEPLVEIHISRNYSLAGWNKTEYSHIRTSTEFVILIHGIQFFLSLSLSLVFPSSSHFPFSSLPCVLCPVLPFFLVPSFPFLLLACFLFLSLFLSFPSLFLFSFLLCNSILPSFLFFHQFFPSNLSLTFLPFHSFLLSVFLFSLFFLLHSFLPFFLLPFCRSFHSSFLLFCFFHS